MAGVRIYGELISLNGTTWKAEIWDDDATPTPYEVTPEGIEINYPNTGDAILEPLKVSEAQFNFANESDEVDDLLDLMVASREDRFKMRIYMNSTLYWVGVVLPDNISWENVSKPRTVSIAAIDGIGRLKDIKFDDVVDNAYADTHTFLEYIKDVLEYNGLSQFWSASATYFRESCGFYDTQMTTTGTSYSPFILTRCDKNLFLAKKNEVQVGIAQAVKPKTPSFSSVTIASSDGDEAASCYDVLFAILQLMMCRMTHVNGCYYIQQIRNFETSTYNERLIRKDAVTVNSYGAASHRQTEGTHMKMLSGGRWSYLAPLQRVSLARPEQNLSAIQSGSGVYLTHSNNSYANALVTTTQLGTLRGGTGSGKSIRIIAKWILGLTAYNYNLWIEFELNCGSGNLYLESSASNPTKYEWVTSAASVQRKISIGSFQSFQSFVVGIQSPEFPSTIEEDCVLTIKYWILNPNGTSSSTPSTNATIWPAEIQCLLNGQAGYQSIYQVENQVSRNSKSIDYGTLRFIDDNQLMTKNNLEVYDGAAWDQSGVVDAGFTTDVSLSKTLCLETMALQKTPILIYQGDHTVNLALGLTRIPQIWDSWYYDSNTFFFNGGVLECATDTVRGGEWIQLLVQKSGVAIDRTQENAPKDNGGFQTPTKKNYNDDFAQRSALGIINAIAYVGGGAITTLYTTAIVNGQIKDNDTIYVLNSQTYGTVSTFKVNGNVSSGATTITVDSKTPDNDIQIGDLVTFGEFNVVTGDEVRGGTMATTSTTVPTAATPIGRTGAFINPANGKFYYQSGTSVYELTGTLLI